MSGSAETTKLKERVKALENAGQNSSWLQNHQVLTWLLTMSIPVVGMGLTIWLAVLPHLEHYQELQIKTEVSDALKEPLGKIDKMETDIASINGTLKAWSPLMVPQILKRSATLSDKELLDSLTQLKNVAELATTEKVPSSTKDVTSIGKRLIQFTSDNSGIAALAWDTTTSFLQYRSALNGLTPPDALASAKPLEPNYHTLYSWGLAPGYERPKVASSGLTVPANQAAAAGLIGEDFNKGRPNGPAFLVVTGGGVTLDKMHLRNVIFVNVHVVYSGGPVQLQNVSFLNCTFQVAPVTNGRQFAEAVLAGPSTVFSASQSG